MKILLIGSGGREHVLAWKMNQSPLASHIFCAPGNAGIASEAKCIDIKADDITGLLTFAIDHGIELTVVGPELPLSLGIADEFRKVGLKIFGPAADAAQLESSKRFAKEFMFRHNIPSAKFEVFSFTEKNKALAYLDNINYPVVIKADGIAAGKGVIICTGREEAEKTIEDMFTHKVFGDSGNNIVIEEFLEGIEASVFAIADGTNYVVLPPSHDYKKIGDNDTGLNTGGMGSYAPAYDIVTPSVMEKVRSRIIEPVLRNMRKEGMAYSGCLYCGLMINSDGEPYVIEFNARFGDPETQSVLPLLRLDLVELLLLSAEGDLKNYNLPLFDDYTCTIVLSSGGYPGSYKTGLEISNLEQLNVLVFHAGTQAMNGKCLTAGGRVLNVTAIGKTLEDAVQKAYTAASAIEYKNKYYRKDIGKPLTKLFLPAE